MSGLLKPTSSLTARSVSKNIDSGTAFGKVPTIVIVFIKAVLISILNISGSTKLENVKTIRGPAESINLIFQNLKCNPISGEIVPLKERYKIILDSSLKRLFCKFEPRQ
jgi:hypothetical protein